MKKPLCDYGNNIWKSPKYIENITGVSRNSQIELNRKNRHGKEMPPFLFSEWAPNAKEVKQTGTGKPREYYFTEILFIALSEQFRINGIPKELLSQFLVYFQYYIEMHPEEPALKMLEEQNGLINFLDFQEQHIIKNSSTYKDGDSENIFWYFQIDTLVTGERIGSIICENYILNKRRSKEIGRFKLLDIKFKICEDLESVHQLQTTEKPKMDSTNSYNELSVTSHIRLNLNAIHKKIKQNTLIFIDKSQD